MHLLPPSPHRLLYYPPVLVPRHLRGASNHGSTFFYFLLQPNATKEQRLCAVRGTKIDMVRREIVGEGIIGRREGSYSKYFIVS